MRLIQTHANMDDAELFRVFNCGVGLVMIVPSKDAEDVLQVTLASGYGAAIIGKTSRRDKGVEVVIQ
jgi:phosphoribosylformylglycinamidine cyclo-ligase